jgi:hypothetical protein
MEESKRVHGVTQQDVLRNTNAAIRHMMAANAAKRAAREARKAREAPPPPPALAIEEPPAALAIEEPPAACDETAAPFNEDWARKGREIESLKTVAFILVGAFVGYLVGDALAPTIAEATVNPRGSFIEGLVHGVRVHNLCRAAGVALGAIFGADLARERKP